MSFNCHDAPFFETGVEGARSNLFDCRAFMRASAAAGTGAGTFSEKHSTYGNEKPLVNLPTDEGCSRGAHLKGTSAFQQSPGQGGGEDEEGVGKAEGTHSSARFCCAKPHILDLELESLAVNLGFSDQGFLFCFEVAQFKVSNHSPSL